MKKISDYLGNELIIIRKNFWKREYELRSGEEIIAQMKHPKIFSDRAELTFQNDIYEFYTPKIFSRNVDIRKKGYQNPFAHLENNFFGSKSMLELPRGNRLNMKFGFFRKPVEIYQGERDLLVSIQSKFSMKERSEVIINKRSETIDENPWIIMLGFYLAQKKRRNAAAAS